MKKHTTNKPIGEFNIVEKGGKFKVFKQGKFCRPFDSRSDAEKYIIEHSKGKHPALVPA